MINKERKKFGLKPARGPKPGEGLANLVAVFTDNQLEFCYIDFSQHFVEFVGSELPYGVSKIRPAYLYLYFCDIQQTWFIYARYTDSDHTKPLWVQKQRPYWAIKTFKGSKYESNTASKARRTRNSDSGSGGRIGT